MARFKWTKQTEEAAELLALGRMSKVAIAERLGIARQTLYNWCDLPQFKARVAEQIDQFRSEVRRRGIATVEGRLAGLNHRHELINLLLSKRADDPLMAEVPGGTTGLLVRDIKRVVVERDSEGGETSREVAVYRFDPGPLRELRELERQAAIELGQWMAGKDRGPVDPEQMADEMEGRDAQYDRSAPDAIGEVPRVVESD